MFRRAVALAAGVALTTAVLPAMAAAPKLKPCPTFADAVGDSMPQEDLPLSALGDPALDITKVVYRNQGSGLAFDLTVAKYAPRPTFSPGNRYEVDFHMDGRLIQIYYKDSATRSVEANVFYQSGIRDGDTDTFLSAAVTGSVSGNTITMVVAKNDLKEALGPKAIGSKISQLTATAYGSYVAYNVAWDVATAPTSLSYVIGAACKK